MNWIFFMRGELCFCVGGLLMTFFIVFSRTNLNEFTCVCVIRKSYKYTYGTNNAFYLLFSCSVETLLPFFACLCEMKAINMLSGCCCCLKDGYFSLLLLWVLWVCFKKTIFFFALISTVHEYMSARVCVCVFNLRMLLASSHYYCFIPSSSFSIIMKKIFFSFVTLLLFLAAFSIASRKIQKGKVQRNVSFAYMSVWVCVC